jgi:YD repeat-containing protein
MTIIRFQLHSSLSSQAALAVLTDFGPSRPKNWPTIDAEHFKVHEIGDTWAEVTEGTSSAWERERYEWDAARERVVITTRDSKLFGPGGGWVFQFTPEGNGTRIDIELTRHPRRLKGKLLASFLPIVAPLTLGKAFKEPFKAK